MEASVSGLAPLLLSLMVSDLSQTANFTGQGKGYLEMNQVAKPFVKHKSPYGEVALGALGLGVLSGLEKMKAKDPSDPVPYILESLWATGHGLAGLGNEKAGFKRMNIVFPTFTVRW